MKFKAATPSTKIEGKTEGPTYLVRLEQSWVHYMQKFVVVEWMVE